jgi:hypothetical protein
MVTLALAIKSDHAAVTQHLGRALDHARRAGDSLIRAKAALAHGRFILWVKACCHFSERTARSYMLIARNWSAIEAKRQSAADLSIRDAIQLLAPQWEPLADEVVVGLLTDGRYLVVERIGHDLARFATFDEVAGDIEYCRRALYFRDLAVSLSACSVDVDGANWLCRESLASHNNPLAEAIPEWKYETAVPT